MSVRGVAWRGVAWRGGSDGCEALSVMLCCVRLIYDVLLCVVLLCCVVLSCYLAWLGLHGVASIMLHQLCCDKTRQDKARMKDVDNMTTQER